MEKLFSLDSSHSTLPISISVGRISLNTLGELTFEDNFLLRTFTDVLNSVLTVNFYKKSYLIKNEVGLEPIVCNNFIPKISKNRYIESIVTIINLIFRDFGFSDIKKNPPINIFSVIIFDFYFTLHYKVI